jgi:hypothetical protein
MRDWGSSDRKVAPEIAERPRKEAGHSLFAEVRLDRADLT